MASGRQVGEENVRILRAWAAERGRSGDWAPFIKSDKLNRSAIAAACGFGRSVFSQNPTVKSFIFDLETQLIKGEVLPKRSSDTETAGDEAAAAEGPSPASDKKLHRLEQEMRKRDERIAVLLAENTELRGRLKRLQHLEQVMETGRRIVP